VTTFWGAETGKFTVQYSTVLYSIVMYIIVIYNTVLYSAVLYWTRRRGRYHLPFRHHLYKEDGFITDLRSKDKYENAAGLVTFVVTLMTFKEKEESNIGRKTSWCRFPVFLDGSESV